jgi:hypothetical protein
MSSRIPTYVPTHRDDRSRKERLTDASAPKGEKPAAKHVSPPPAHAQHHHHTGRTVGAHGATVAKGVGDAPASAGSIAGELGAVVQGPLAGVGSVLLARQMAEDLRHGKTTDALLHGTEGTYDGLLGIKGFALLAKGAETLPEGLATAASVTSVVAQNVLPFGQVGVGLVEVGMDAKHLMAAHRKPTKLEMFMTTGALATATGGIAGTAEVLGADIVDPKTAFAVATTGVLTRASAEIFDYFKQRRAAKGGQAPVDDGDWMSDPNLAG